MYIQNPIDLSKVIKSLDKIDPRGCVVLGFQAQLGKFQCISEICNEADNTVWLSRSPQGAIDEAIGQARPGVSAPVVFPTSIGYQSQEIGF